MEYLEPLISKEIARLENKKISERTNYESKVKHLDNTIETLEDMLLIDEKKKTKTKRGVA